MQEFNNKSLADLREDDTRDEQGSALSPVDADKYRSLISDFELSEAEERQMLEALWSIMYSFVQLGFDVKNCGQIVESLNLAAQADSAAIDSTDPTISEKRATPSGKTKRHE